MFELLFADDALVAVNKPAGMLVHRSTIDKHETRFVLQELRNQLGRHVFPVHRLDKPTSGVLLFALSGDIARQLSEQFVANTVDKRYWLVCRGHTPARGDIDYPLVPKNDFKSRHGHEAPPKPAQSALTRYTQLARYELNECVDKYPSSRYSWLEAQLVTGRKHQLRRHMKHIAHPIIGDSRYGKASHNQFFKQRWGCSRLLLHCRSMQLQHPLTGQNIQLQAALDEQFTAVLEGLAPLRC